MKIAAASALLVGLCLSSTALADTAPAEGSADQAPAPPPPSVAEMTGDWGGLRTRLSDKGVSFGGYYVAETAWNFSGGEKKRVAETNQLGLWVTLDTERLWGLEGGTIQALATFRAGRSLTSDAGLGVLMPVQEVYGRGRTARLTQFWYDQKLAGGAVDLKVGRATVSEDFAAFSCDFMNLTFCSAPPGNIASDYWYGWPISQWMTRIRLNHREVYAQAGAYQVNPDDLRERFTGGFKGGKGVLAPVEFGWTHAFGAQRLEGTYRVGGWYSDVDASDVLLDARHQPRAVSGLAPLIRSSRSGYWAYGSQQLTGASVNGMPVSGVSAFFNFTQADRQTSIADQQIAAGIVWKAPLRSLPKDELAFAVGRTSVNGRFARGAGFDPRSSRLLGAEYTAEVYYALHPFSWLEMRPNLQYIHHPGGNRDAQDVGVMGLKIGLHL